MTPAARLALASERGLSRKRRPAVSLVTAGKTADFSFQGGGGVGWTQKE
jgi:hypothetical protein